MYAAESAGPEVTENPMATLANGASYVIEWDV